MTKSQIIIHMKQMQGHHHNKTSTPNEESSQQNNACIFFHFVSFNKHRLPKTLGHIIRLPPDSSPTIKSKNHKDIYLSTTKAKCILNLNNYKQKTIENFLGIYRDDKYDGGQLIPVYNDFSETNNLDSKKLVLLHNMEDVKGMCCICKWHCKL